MSPRIPLLCCWLAATLCAGIPDDVHAASARLHGAVTDQSGAAIAAATVEVISLDSGLTASTVSDEAGHYAFDALPAGRYVVSAASPGFDRSLRQEISVAASGGLRIDFVLTIGRQEALVVVTAPVIARESDAIASEMARTSDTASLLDGLPGVSVYGGGGVSGLPAIHGMGDDRVKVLVNGMSIQPACGNHMNPPLSYIDPANVGKISLMAGITPVSSGGDSIGGSISVESPAPQFAKPGEGLIPHGSFSTAYRGNGGVNVGTASLSVAGERIRVAYTGSYAHADNYRSGSGTVVKSTFYEVANHALQVAARGNLGALTFNVGVQRIPQQGFVNARMDMTSNTSRLFNGRYERLFRRAAVDARAYYERTDHEMNVIRDKVPGMRMPMDTRGTNAGYSVNLRVSLRPRDTLRAGSEFHRFALDDWWPPVSAAVGSMGPETLWNIRAGRRHRLGTYGEWEGHRGTAWTTLLGVRSDVVFMKTGNVAGYNMSPTTTASAAYYADAVEFNARDHARRDSNLDLTGLARFEPNAIGSYEIGYARKTRSPSLYERYLWVKRSNMSVQMNGWFGDANGYTGNLDLRPEVAHTVSGTAGWHDAARTRELRMTPYYTFVRDYVDVDRCPVIAGSNGCTAAKLTATAGFVNLVFANHDARIAGVDLSGRIPLGGNVAVGAFALTGVASYVRGRNLDTGDVLYRMMPLNARLTLEHTRGRLTSGVALQAVSAKNDAQRVRVELPTPGYALVNARAGYRWDHLSLDVGIENLFDRSFLLPLGGRYWVGDKTGASSVPGMGRTVFGGVTVKF